MKIFKMGNTCSLDIKVIIYISCRKTWYQSKRSLNLRNVPQENLKNLRMCLHTILRSEILTKVTNQLQRDMVLH